MHKKNLMLYLVFYTIHIVHYIVNDRRKINLDPISCIVSQNLKRLREQKKLSLDGVAKLSGVSKSMLGQIERGEVNPTITTVWKIANGLKISFSELLSHPATGYEVVDIASIEPLLEDDGHYRNYLVFPFEENRRFEMLYIEMDPGSHLDADPHPEGTQEYITVFSGELAVEVHGETFAAKDRCSICFTADRPHRYQNISTEVCRLSMVLTYARD